MQIRASALVLLMLPVFAGCLESSGGDGVDGSIVDGGGPGASTQPSSEPGSPGHAAPPVEGEILEGVDGSYVCSAPGTEVKVDPNRTFEGGAHQHDMWGGQDRLTIFEGRVDKFGGGGWFEMPGAVVHPGTGRVEFVLEWTDAVAVLPETRKLYWDMPGDKKTVVDMFSHTFSKSGQNHSFAINLSNNDPPHYSRTTWTFKVEPASATKVTWIIDRGYDCLPIDPPHYDLWKGALEKSVGESVKKYDGHVVCAQNVCTMSPGHYGFQLEGENTTVPPGTSRVVVTLSWTNSRPWPGKLGLEYTTALSLGGSTSATWRRAINPQEAGPTTRVFEIVAGPEDWDSPYRTKSAWYYDWYFDNGSNNAVLNEAGTLGGEITIKAVAHRSP